MDNFDSAVIDDKNLTNDTKKINVGREGKIVHGPLDMISIQYADGRFSEGYTDDFSPTIPFFHLSQITDKSHDENTKIFFDLKPWIQRAYQNRANVAPETVLSAEQYFR